jgi:hypothetical protein
MIKIKRLPLLLLGMLISGFSFAQCPTGEVEVKVDILTDNYGYETSWTLSDQTGTVLMEGGQGGVYESFFSYSDSICITEGTCLTFEIFDEFGDGIYSPYGYRLSLNEVVLDTGANEINDYSMFMINCPPGTACNNAVTVSEGSHTSDHTNFWYTFTPTQTGTYQVEACDNGCDTKLWVYDYCEGLAPAEDNSGTIYFDDEQGGCAPQAMINAMLMEAGVEYWIRIGSNSGDCVGSIDWSLSYNGPVEGCMDPAACNYQPLATVSDGNCIYPGDPACPDGPDLIVLEDVMINSMYMAELNVPANDCSVEEGCNNGYGDRDILRFTTHIQNIGNTDYYIGSPAANPDQFDLENCHNHTHYKGYAEYRLFDLTGQEIPIGFKNGFCVMDLECSMGGTFQYGCSTMGISALCGDIYSSGLTCQWIDITDVDPGVYTMVNRTNWDNDPDGLGNVELNLNNNWAQACIEIFVNGNGNKDFTLDTNCNPYTDCLGDIYGSAQYDCLGECNGPALRGDLNIDTLQNLTDGQMYVTGILAGNIPATECNDLSADGEIDVFDAALINDCYLSHEGFETGAYHEHCSFPQNVTNIFDTVKLSIGAINYDEQYVDILIENPDNYVVAYEFEMSGIELSTAENLIDPADYPITPSVQLGGNKVVGISYQDSLVDKYFNPTALVRLYWFATTATQICIENITVVVNSFYERTEVVIDGDCVAATGITELETGITLGAYPNPFSTTTTIEVENIYNRNISMNVIDPTGKIVIDLGSISQKRITFDRASLANGMYFVQVIDSEGVLSRMKLIIQ